MSSFVKLDHEYNFHDLGAGVTFFFISSHSEICVPTRRKSAHSPADLRRAQISQKVATPVWVSHSIIHTCKLQRQTTASSWDLCRFHTFTLKTCFYSSQHSEQQTTASLMSAPHVNIPGGHLQTEWQALERKGKKNNLMLIQSPVQLLQIHCVLSPKRTLCFSEM